jgi:hypothetical protein
MDPKRVEVCWCLVLMVVLLTDAAVLPSQSEQRVQDGGDNHAEIGSPLRVAQCRAMCLLKVSFL